MKIFNISPLELIFILIVALIILGPKDMVKAGAQLGRFVRKVVKSPIWRSIVSTSNEIREIPKKIVSDTGLDEDLKELEKASKVIGSDVRKEMGVISNAIEKDVKNNLQDVPVDLKRDIENNLNEKAVIPPPDEISVQDSNK